MPCSQTAQNNTTDVQLSAVCISVTVITPAISNKCQCFLTCLIPSVLRLFTCGPSSANYLFLSCHVLWLLQHNASSDSG